MDKIDNYKENSSDWPDPPPHDATIEPESKDKSDAGHPIGIQDLHGQVKRLSVSTNVHTPPENIESVLLVQEPIVQHPQKNRKQDLSLRSENVVEQPQPAIHQPEPVIQQPEPVREQEDNRLKVLSNGFAVFLNWQFEQQQKLERDLHNLLQRFNPDPSYEELAAENRRLLLQVQNLQGQLMELRRREHRNGRRR